MLPNYLHNNTRDSKIRKTVDQTKKKNLRTQNYSVSKGTKNHFS
jgi:hypothetical protein